MLRRLVLGLVLLLARFLLRFVLIRRQADGLPHHGVLDIILQVANLSLGAPLGMSYVVPLLLWLALFRHSLTGANRTQA